MKKLRNWWGNSGGYSGCHICGETWNWKKEHTIKYSESAGAFPICEECWLTKTDEEILNAVEDLCQQWLIQSPAHFYEETKVKVELLRRAAKEQVKERFIHKKEPIYFIPAAKGA